MSCVTHKKKPPNRVTSFAANTNSSGNNCVVCKTEKHPLYVCAKFRSLSHDEKVSVLKTNNLCSNCLTSGHFKRQCKSIHKCKVCQKLHHTLLHIYQQNPTPPAGSQTATPVSSTPVSSTPVSSNGGMKLKVEHFTHDMPCVCHRSRWVIRGTQSAAGQRVICVIRIQATGSKSFFASLQSKCLSVWHWWCVTKGPYPSFQISAVGSNKRKIGITAVVVPKVTCDLPLAPVPFQLNWKHLADLDPGFGQPGRIDMLLGVNLFLDVLCHGRRSGPLESPTALETEFGWVLCGSAGVTTFHSTVTSGDDILRQFWEIEETPADHSALSTEERTVVRHFESNHSRSKEGRFVVPLPRNPSAKQIGESRSQAIIKEIPLTRTLSHCKGSLQGARPCHARIS